MTAKGLAEIAEGETFVAGAVVHHDASDSNSQTLIMATNVVEEVDGAFLLVDQHLAEGDAGIIVIQTWTNSQPMPLAFNWPILLPVMRWPTRSNRPSSLMSI